MLMECIDVQSSPKLPLEEATWFVMISGRAIDSIAACVTSEKALELIKVTSCVM